MRDGWCLRPKSRRNWKRLREKVATVRTGMLCSSYLPSTGKVEYSLLIGERSFKLNLETKRVVINGDADKKLRRHVMSDGLAGMWEILSVNYKKQAKFVQGE
jgi:hypothetical protein